MYYDRSYNEGYGAASNAAAASVQPLKFGGKELERRGNILPNDDVTYRKVNGVEYSNHQE